MAKRQQSEKEAEAERERLFAAEKAQAALKGAGSREAKRAFSKVWLAWIGLGAILGAVLFWIIASEPSQAIASWSDLLWGIGPMLLALLVAWPIMRYLLLPTFGDETDWLVVTFLLTVFSIFLGLLALGVVLLLILLGLKGRVRYRGRWALACYVGAGLVTALLYLLPGYALGPLDMMLLGAGALAFMAAVTGLALRTML